MSDVIIAIVPAAGREGLMAEGPMGERPALLVLHRGAWVAWPAPAVRSHPDPRPRALVLYAPGGPRLGMVRLGMALRLDYDPTPNDISARTMGNLARSCGLASEVLVLPVTS